MKYKILDSSTGKELSINDYAVDQNGEVACFTHYAGFMREHDQSKYKVIFGDIYSCDCGFQCGEDEPRGHECGKFYKDTIARLGNELAQAGFSEGFEQEEREALSYLAVNQWSIHSGQKCPCCSSSSKDGHHPHCVISNTIERLGATPHIMTPEVVKQVSLP